MGCSALPSFHFWWQEGHSLMWTSVLLIQPLYLQQHTYKDPSQDLVPNNLTIRYFRFLELFLTYMRILCCLNQMYFLLLGMMDQACCSPTHGIHHWTTPCYINHTLKGELIPYPTLLWLS